MRPDPEACSHQPVYLGVVNINVQERTIGSVDVWHCGACKKRFCEEKQLGIEALAEQVGMPKIGPGEKWGVVVCRLQKGRDRWRLARLGASGDVPHECLGERHVRLPVKDFAVASGGGGEDRGGNDAAAAPSAGAHWSFLVDDHLNEAVEI